MAFHSVAWAILAAAAVCHGGITVPAELAGRDATLDTLMSPAVVGLDMQRRDQPMGTEILPLSWDVSMSKNNTDLFSGTVDNKNDNKKVTLKVTCNECYTRGMVHSSINNAFTENPSLRVDLGGLEAYADMGLLCDNTIEYAIPLWTSVTPIGFGGLGFDVGVVVILELVFTMEDEVELVSGGFYVALPPKAFVEATIKEGHFIDYDFEGITVKSLPYSTMKNETTTLKAALRVTVQCGCEVGIAGIGAGVELGIYANVIEFSTELTTNGDNCAGLSATEVWDCNIGAFAEVGVNVDFAHFGVTPSAATTILTIPAGSQCYTDTYSATTTTAPQISTITTIVNSMTTTTMTLPYTAPPYTGTTPPAYTPPAATSTFTYVTCGVNMSNCPASYQSTITVTTTTTSATTTTQTVSPPVYVVVTDVVTLQTCPVPVVSTWSASATTALSTSTPVAYYTTVSSSTSANTYWANSTVSSYTTSDTMTSAYTAAVLYDTTASIDLASVATSSSLGVGVVPVSVPGLSSSGFLSPSSTNFVVTADALPKPLARGVLWTTAAAAAGVLLGMLLL